MDSHSKPALKTLPPSQQQQTTRSSPRLRERAIIFEVLDNPSLLEEILKHVILDKVKKVDRRAACTLRQVNSSWNESVVKILWKAHQHLFTLVGESIWSLDTPMKTFASSISTSPITRYAVPPIFLRMISDIRSSDILESFSNCLTRCGPRLVKMEIGIWEYGHPLQTLLPQWSLSRLHKLDIIVWLDFGSGDHQADKVAVDNEKVPSYLINSILTSSTSLSELDLFGIRQPLENPRPSLPIFDSLTLPRSLAIIKIGGDLTSRDLEVMARSPLPNLTLLDLSVLGSALFENGLFLRILKNVTVTLKTLSITDGHYEGPPRNRNMMEFPVMFQLEELTIASINAELEETAARSISKSLPKLRILRLRNQTADMFRKWTVYSKLESMTSLQLLLADESIHEFDLESFLQSVDAEMMQMAAAAFPNLRKLELGVTTKDTSGLEYVFREMRQLTKLKIRVCSVQSEKSTDVWDSILTGVPMKTIAKARKNPRAWEKKKLDTENSIKNMQELTTFSIVDCRGYSANVRHQLSVPSPYFSDFTFNQALLKMPKLKYVGGPFETSDEIKEKWLSDGRNFFVEPLRSL